MHEPKPGLTPSGLRENLRNVRQEISNSESAIDAEGARDYLLKGVEMFDRYLDQFVGWAAKDALYSNGYWAIREMSSTTPRPRPLVSAEARRLERWLDEIDTELVRIEREEEWDETGIPRIMFDTSAIARQGDFDSFDWPGHVASERVRLIVPILAVRELDDLKNFRKNDRARPRLKKLLDALGSTGRGPAAVSSRTSIELLMDPPHHVRLANHDEEIVRRAVYLAGRRGGPLRLVTGDYTMVFTGRAAGVQSELTPAEIVLGTSEHAPASA